MTILTAKVHIQPESDPLLPSDCYKHLRIIPDADSDGLESSEDDALISAYISAARQYCERFTGWSLAAKGYVATVEGEFPSVIELPHPPLIRIESITYDVAESDSEVDPSAYVLNDSGALPKITPVSSSIWPTLSDGSLGHVYYRAGFAVPGDESEPQPLPGWARIAILLMVGHFYKNREAVDNLSQIIVPMGADALLRQNRIDLSMA